MNFTRIKRVNARKPRHVVPLLLTVAVMGLLSVRCTLSMLLELQMTSDVETPFALFWRKFRPCVEASSPIIVGGVAFPFAPWKALLVMGLVECTPASL